MQSAPILSHRDNKSVDAMGVGKGLTPRRQDGHPEPSVSFLQEDNAFVAIRKGLPPQDTSPPPISGKTTGLVRKPSAPVT